MGIYVISISYRYDKFRIYQHRNLLTSTTYPKRAASKHSALTQPLFLVLPTSNLLFRFLLII